MLEKHFVTFYSPGTFVAETNIEEIDSWDVEEACKRAKKIKQRYDARPFAFDFQTRGREENELDSRVLRRSPTYYINGKVFTLEDIEAENDPRNKTLLTNMRCNGWDRIVRTNNSWAHTDIFADDDQIVNVDFDEED